jgi:hypothetical protein
VRCRRGVTEVDDGVRHTEPAPRCGGQLLGHVRRVDGRLEPLGQGLHGRGGVPRPHDSTRGCVERPDRQQPGHHGHRGSARTPGRGQAQPVGPCHEQDGACGDEGGAEQPLDLPSAADDQSGGGGGEEVPDRGCAQGRVPAPGEGIVGQRGRGHHQGRTHEHGSRRYQPDQEPLHRLPLPDRRRPSEPHHLTEQRQHDATGEPAGDQQRRAGQRPRPHRDDRGEHHEPPPVRQQPRVGVGGHDDHPGGLHERSRQRARLDAAAR